MGFCLIFTCISSTFSLCMCYNVVWSVYNNTCKAMWMQFVGNVSENVKDYIL